MLNPDFEIEFVLARSDQSGRLSDALVDCVESMASFMGGSVNSKADQISTLYVEKSEKFQLDKLVNVLLPNVRSLKIVAVDKETGDHAELELT